MLATKYLKLHNSQVKPLLNIKVHRNPEENTLADSRTQAKIVVTLNLILRNQLEVIH